MSSGVSARHTTSSVRLMTNCDMGKLVSITETARRLGMTTMSLRNWISKGFINVKRVGKARYIDEDTILALQDTVDDINRQRKALEVIRDDDARELERKRTQRDYRRLMRAVTRMCLENGFFDMMLGILRETGDITTREGDVASLYVHGTGLYEICDKYGLTSGMILNIVNSAVRKGTKMTFLKEQLSSIDRLRTDNETLKAGIEAVRARLREQEKEDEEIERKSLEERRKAIMERDELCSKLSVRIVDTMLSVRSMNVLKSMDCNTVGDICRLNKTDFLKQRNAGTKSLSEVDDFLTDMGLSWSMDVDRIYAERVDSLMNDEFAKV